MTLVVVGHGSSTTLFHRQAGLGSVERLNLALLIDGQDNGMGRWIDMEADHIAQFVDEGGVVGQLELPHSVWLEPIGAPDALH
jgi:hypothetical protein